MLSPIRDEDKIREYVDSIKSKVKGADIISINATYNMGTTVLPSGTFEQLIADMEAMLDELDYVEDNRWLNG